jgi:hypothetical protein
MASLLRKYNLFMEAKPLLGVSISTGVCYGIGDYLAQYIERSQGKRDTTSARRLLVFTGFGTLVAGPIYYGWFNKLKKVPALIERLVKYNETRFLARKFHEHLDMAIKDNTLDKVSFQTFRRQFQISFDRIDKPIIRSKTVLVAKVYLDQFVFSVAYPIFFMISTTMLMELTDPKTKFTYRTEEDGRVKLTLAPVTESFQHGWTNVKDKFAKIYMTDCAVWPLVQMANFALVPEHLQPVFLNCVNIFWNAFLCYVSQDGGH